MSGDEVRRIGSSIVMKGLHITPYSRPSFPLVYLVMVQFKSNHRRVALACKPFFSLLAIVRAKTAKARVALPAILFPCFAGPLRVARKSDRETEREGMRARLIVSALHRSRPRFATLLPVASGMA